METSVIKKKLSKFSTSQLLAKVEKNSLTEEEMSIALGIIEQRTGINSSFDEEVEVSENKLEDLPQVDQEEVDEGSYPNPGEITVEQINEAIDKIYETNDPEAVKGMISLFKREIFDYSELTQEERASILNYSNQLGTNVSGETESDIKKPDSKKPVSKKSNPKKSDVNGYGFNANDFDGFKIDGDRFLLEGKDGEFDVSEFQGIDVIRQLGGSLKKGQKLTITTYKGKVVEGELTRISFSSKPYVFYPYIKDSEGNQIGFRLSSVKSITLKK